MSKAKTRTLFFDIGSHQQKGGSINHVKHFDFHFRPAKVRRPYTFAGRSGNYLIGSVSDLQTLATYVNDGGDTSGLKFKLTADISGVDFHIGNYSKNAFKGTFDGGGHKITVNIEDNTQQMGTALFCYIDGTINTSAKYAAGIAAQIFGTTNINDCRSSVTINSTVSGDGTHGGFFSAAGGTLNINNSSFAPTQITIGTNGSATFARNGVNGTNGGYYTQNFGTAQGGTQIYTLTLLDNVNATCADPTNYEVTYGGKTYYKSTATITLTPTTTPENMTIKGATKNDDGTYSYTLTDNTKLVWELASTAPNWSGHTEDLPEEVEGVITITSAGQLAKLAANVNDGTSSYEGKTIKLGNDIDLSDKFWTAIGKGWDGEKGPYFKVTFDGDGHTISGLSINATTDYQGLFGYVEDGTIKNVNLTGVNITSTKSYVGGLVGRRNGSGIVKNNLVIDATVNGKFYYIGAVFGYNGSSGTVSNNFYYNIADDRKGVGIFAAGSEDNGTTSFYKLTLP